MGKQNRRREAQQREIDSRVGAVLKARSQSDARPRAADYFRDVNPEYRDKIEALRGYALRPPEDWRCRIKSQSEERRLLDLVRFVFARYRVPQHLEQVWIEEVDDDFTDRIAMPNRAAGRRPGAPDLCRWYLVAAQGGSLHKREAYPYLSKQETHHFLNAPAEIASAKHAFWFAVARAQTDSVDAAIKVSRCKIVVYSIASTFWKEVARLFARHPLAVHQMDDLADFLLVAKREDPAFTLKGRTLLSLTRRMEEWHHALRCNYAIGGGNWPGSPLPDIDYKVGKDANRAIWRFRQIKTGDELFDEGRRMRHCVAFYKTACMRGDISIWSLACEFPIGQINRGVTLEVTNDGRIVQCRGFANRLPYANEATMVKRWAREHGLTWASR